MNDKKFLEKVMSELDVKKTDILETFEDQEKITSLYIVLKRPMKFSVTREEGFCLVIADALDFSQKRLYFVIADYDVLEVKWDKLINVKWEECPEEDYLKELKKYEDFDFD